MAETHDLSVVIDSTRIEQSDGGDIALISRQDLLRYLEESTAAPTEPNEPQSYFYREATHEKLSL